MSELTITSREDETELSIDIQGSINETFLQKTVRLSPGKEIIIDFEKVASINSLGIRYWIQWLRTYPSSSFIFRNCPQCIIDQMNAVADFMPQQCLVESFFVPYFSEGTGEERRVLYKINEDYKIGLIPKIKTEMDSEGHVMQLDVYPQKYFRFITKA